MPLSLLRFSPQLGLRHQPGVMQGYREAENKNSGLMSPWKSLLPEPQLWSLNNIISSHSSPFISPPGEAGASPWPLHVILGSRKVEKRHSFSLWDAEGWSWQHRGKDRQALTRSGNFFCVCVWGGEVDFVVLLLGHTQKCSGITVSFVIKNHS